jgi:ABC-type polar amino acid transport system ATPase subunit
VVCSYKLWLWKAFGSLEVLKGVSLRVERGSVVAIIGPSGSGKSTLLRCINLLEDPDRGRIRVGDREMCFGERTRAKPGDRELSAFRAATGMVFQHFNLFPHMTALGNVMAGPTIVKRAARPESGRPSKSNGGSRARIRGPARALCPRRYPHRPPQPRLGGCRQAMGRERRRAPR